jgi:hypothetical protein
MSILFFLISVLVLLYLNTRSTVSAIVLTIMTLSGMYIDNGSFLSIILGGSLLAIAYILLV